MFIVLISDVEGGEDDDNLDEDDKEDVDCDCVYNYVIITLRHWRSWLSQEIESQGATSYQEQPKKGTYIIKS